jgi:hypothetical protein
MINVELIETLGRYDPTKSPAFEREPGIYLSTRVTCERCEKEFEEGMTLSVNEATAFACNILDLLGWETDGMQMKR